MHRHCPEFAAFLGFLILVSGLIFTFYVIPAIKNNYLHKSSMRSNSIALKYFENPPLVSQFKVYFFNVMNPEDVVSNGKHPVLKEVGPYVYDIHESRQVIAINDTTETLEYFIMRKYYFNGKDSKTLDENDMITIINPAFIGIIESKEGDDSMYEPYKLEDITGGVFITIKVKDYLFDGIKLSCHQDVHIPLCVDPTLITNLFRFKGKEEILFSQFGELNNSREGPFVINTGLKKTSRGRIISYQHTNKLGIWKKSCDMINGTDLKLFGSIELIPRRIYTFLPSLCRSVYFVFDREATYFNLASWVFVMNQEPLTNNKENRCFRPKYTSTTHKVSLSSLYSAVGDPTGTMNLHSCFQFPLILSYPHFYLSDKSLSNYAGLKPNRKLHQSFVAIEPGAGWALARVFRFQFNILLPKHASVDLLANVSEGIFPILWFEENTEPRSDQIEQVQRKIYVMKLLTAGKFALVALGIFIMSLSTVLLMCCPVPRSYKIPSSVFAILVSEQQESNYPHLYPQVQNKNISGNLLTTKR